MKGTKRIVSIVLSVVMLFSMAVVIPTTASGANKDILSSGYSVPTEAQFIAKLLSSNPNVQVTRLAYGLPVGGNLDYADEFTLLKAIQGRRKI